MKSQLPKPWLTSGGVEIPTEQLSKICQTWDPPTWERYLKWYEGKRREVLISATLFSKKCDQIEDSIFSSHSYNRSLKLCGIDYVSGTHLIRKTSATQANRMTGDFYAVSKNLGHSSLEETQRYVEEVDEGKWKVARALDEVARAALMAPKKGEK